MDMPDKENEALDTTLALNAREAARAIGISERLLRKMTKAGSIPHVRLGESTRCRLVYPIDDLRRWLSAKVSWDNIDSD